MWPNLMETEQDRRQLERNLRNAELEAQLQTQASGYRLSQRLNALWNVVCESYAGHRLTKEAYEAYKRQIARVAFQSQLALTDPELQCISLIHRPTLCGVPSPAEAGL